MVSRNTFYDNHKNNIDNATRKYFNEKVLCFVIVCSVQLICYGTTKNKFWIKILLKNIEFLDLKNSYYLI